MPSAELHYVDQEIWCRTPYDPAFVAELKATIPFPYRRWEPVDKVWRIDTLFEEEIADLCREHFGDVRIIRPDETKAGGREPEHYRALFILPEAPIVVVEAAYRALAKLWHPDVSDDPNAVERMQAINLAYQRIKQERS